MTPRTPPGRLRGAPCPRRGARLLALLACALAGLASSAAAASPPPPNPPQATTAVQDVSPSPLNLYAFSPSSGFCTASGGGLYGSGTEGAYNGLFAAVPAANCSKCAFNFFGSNSFVEFYIKCVAPSGGSSWQTRVVSVT